MLVLLASASAWAQMPGRCEVPVSERTGDIGCYVLESKLLGALPDTPLFWHLYVFPSRAAAETAKSPRYSIVESFGKIWLFSIAPHDWHPSTGAGCRSGTARSLRPQELHRSLLGRDYSAGREDACPYTRGKEGQENISLLGCDMVQSKLLQRVGKIDHFRDAWWLFKGVIPKCQSHASHLAVKCWGCIGCPARDDLSFAFPS
jgi:hypothetical protein